MNGSVQLDLFSNTEQEQLLEEYENRQQLNKQNLLKKLRKELDLVYFKEPVTNNDIMLNLQYEYLTTGSEKAKSKLWIMAYQMVNSILCGVLKRRKLYLSQDDKEEKVASAVIDVMKRYEKIYYKGDKEEKKAKLYPYAYSVKNYVLQFQLAVKKTLGYVPHIEYSLEDIERIESPYIEYQEEEEIMKEALKNYFEKAIAEDPALKEAYSEKKLDKCISYITSQARKHLSGKNGAIEDTVVYKWARDYMYGDIKEESKETKPADTEDFEEMENIEEYVTANFTEQKSSEPKPNKKTKAKKEELEEEYDGPYLFDFLNDGE